MYRAHIAAQLSEAQDRLRASLVAKDVRRANFREPRQMRLIYGTSSNRPSATFTLTEGAAEPRGLGVLYAAGHGGAYKREGFC